MSKSNTPNSSLAILGSAAILVALALLGLQILGGLEATEGGSLYTRASMIAAMITLACLPMFIEAARHLSKGLVLALCVSFVSFLAYSLPATTGRTGEIKETNVVEQSKSIEDLDRVKADHVRTVALVDDSNRWQLKACKGGNGPDCKSATFVLNQRKASLEKLSKQLDDAKPVKIGDLGSDLWAWALGFLGVTAATVRKISVLSFAIGLDVVIWSLIWFATAAFSKAATAANTATIASKDGLGTGLSLVGTDEAGFASLPDPAMFAPTADWKAPTPSWGGELPEPPTKPKKRKPRTNKRQERAAKVDSFVDKYIERHGHAPKYKTIKGAFKMPNATASRYYREAMDKRASV
jgi:hypothetical protein